MMTSMIESMDLFDEGEPECLVVLSFVHNGNGGLFWRNGILWHEDIRSPDAALRDWLLEAEASGRSLFLSLVVHFLEDVSPVRIPLSFDSLDELARRVEACEESWRRLMELHFPETLALCRRAPAAAPTECALRRVAVSGPGGSSELSSGGGADILRAACRVAAETRGSAISLVFEVGAEQFRVDAEPPFDLGEAGAGGLLDWMIACGGSDGSLAPEVLEWCRSARSRYGEAPSGDWPAEAGDQFVLLEVRASAGVSGAAFLLAERSPGIYDASAAFGPPGFSWRELAAEASELAAAGRGAVLISGGVKSRGETARQWLEAKLAGEEPLNQVSGLIEFPDWLKPAALPVPEEVAELLAELSSARIDDAVLAERTRRTARRAAGFRLCRTPAAVRPLLRKTALPDAGRLGVCAADPPAARGPAPAGKSGPQLEAEPP